MVATAERASVAERYERAHPHIRALIDRLLERDAADGDDWAATWRAQIGPALTQRDTAALLGKSPQAVAKDPGLVRVPTRDRRVMYPVWQFDGRRRVDGVAEVVAAVGQTVAPSTVAAWLTAPNPQLDGRAPIAALRAGDRDRVVALAEQLAGDLA